MIQFKPTQSIQEIDKQIDSIFNTIYPNPSSGSVTLTIEKDKKYKLYIYDQVGKMILHTDHSK